MCASWPRLSKALARDFVSQLLPELSAPTTATWRGLMALMPPTRKLGSSFGDLYKDFVAFDHAQFVASPLFHHVQAFFEIAEFSAQLFQAAACFFIGLLLLCQFLAQLVHMWQAAWPEPQLGLHHRQQGEQHDGDQAVAHVSRLSAGYKTRCGRGRRPLRPSLPQCAAAGCT